VDFREAGHLPSRGEADPDELPRQRKGITPQMHGRYPDFDVLAEAEHWDDVTRKVVFDRVDNEPEIRFFDANEAVVLGILCDLLTAQDAEPRIPVLAFVDEKLFLGKGDGYQFYDLPSDGDTWRTVARALHDEQLVELGAEERHALVHRFSRGEVSGGAWDELNPTRAFSVVMRHVCEAFYSHPWAWNEIGFGGPAYPRGYAAFGSPGFGEREHWEGVEAFSLDPVKDTQERGLE
jgi:hypothetical protein